MLKRLGQFIDTLADRANEESGAVVRLHGNEAQVPTVTYRHHDTGRLVRLVGVMHVAVPSFYEGVNKLIDDHPESAVLYEMVGGDPSKEGDATPEEIAKAKERMQPLKELYQMMADATGCVSQKDGLPIREGWINTDLSAVQFFYELRGGRGPAPQPSRGSRASKPTPLQQLMADRILDGLQRQVDQMKRPGMAAEIRRALHRSVRMFRYANLIGKVTESAGPQLPLFGIVLHRRNDVGVAGILEHVQKSDVISIWGAAHLPGMDKQLRAAGFEEVGREWRTVLVFPDEE